MQLRQLEKPLVTPTVVVSPLVLAGSVLKIRGGAETLRGDVNFDGVLASAHEGRLTAYQTLRMTTILDLTERRAVGWIGDAAALSYFEIGKPLPIEMAKLQVRTFQGLSLDWIYFDEVLALSGRLRDAIERVESELRSEPDKKVSSSSSR